jgi:PD-(D/E)XK endonuclease
MDLRRKHPRQQGDLGEAAAIQWLTEIGAGVSFPLFHSPDYDLIAELNGHLLRVQVKTGTRVHGSGFCLQLATNGGNQSWGGVVKRFDPASCDFLFALVGDGRRWFIPTSEIVATTSIVLGGRRYEEYEVERAGGTLGRSTIAEPQRGSAGAGEPGQTVNLVPQAEWVRIPPPPLTVSSETETTPLAAARTRASAHHQITIPKPVFEAARLRAGDQFRVEAIAAGRLRVTRVGEVASDHAAALTAAEE